MTTGNRTYDRLIITRGYPRKDDNERILNMSTKNRTYDYWKKLEVQPS